MPKARNIIAGDRFNRFTVIKEVEKRNGRRQFLCKCDCGNERIIDIGNLTSGHSTSCGCAKLDRPFEVDRQAEIGKRYGKLTILGYKDINAKWNDLMALCRCDCGNEKYIRLNKVRTGWTQSCGCLHREITSQMHYKHGGSKERLYNVWDNIKARCYNPNNTEYQNYGGRGIGLCKEWMEYSNFRTWAYANGYDEEAPYSQCTIDRIDVNGNYEPSNCRWVDCETQCNNKRNNIRISYNGETHTVKEWSEITGLKRSVIKDRYQRGIPAEDILYVGNLSEKRRKRNGHKH